MSKDDRLSPEELAAAKERRASARASLAIEGMAMAPEDEAHFDMLEAEGCGHKKCAELIEVEHPREDSRTLDGKVTTVAIA